MTSEHVQETAFWLGSYIETQSYTASQQKRELEQGARTGPRHPPENTISELSFIS